MSMSLIQTVYVNCLQLSLWAKVNIFNMREKFFDRGGTAPMSPGFVAAVV